MKKNTEFIKLPESELEVMQIIWDMDRAGYKDIHAAGMFEFAPAIGRLKMTTVLTLITRLIGKGFLTVHKVGRANCYTPAVDETAYKNFATRDFLETMYKNNASGLISALIGGDCLKESDIDALRRYIDESEKNG